MASTIAPADMCRTVIQGLLNHISQALGSTPDSIEQMKQPCSGSLIAPREKSREEVWPEHTGLWHVRIA